MKDALSDYLHIWGFENDAILFSDGSMGFGLEIIPVDVSCWAVEQINDFSSRVSQFLNGLSDNIDLQFVQDITNGNEQLLERHSASGEHCSSIVVNELTSARVKRLRDLDNSGLLPKHTLTLFVRKAAQRALIDKPKFFSRARHFEQIADDRLSFEIAALERLKGDILMGLGQLGLKSESLTVERIMDLTYSQWNPTRSVARTNFDPDDLRGSLLFTDVGIYDRGFSMGDMHYRILSLKLLPDQTFATMAAALRGLPFDSRLQLSIHVPNQQKELETLQLQRRVAFSMIAGKRSGVSDLDSEAKFRDLETLLEQMVSQGEKVFHIGLQVVLRARTQEELDELVSQALMKFRDLAGAEGMEESLAAFDVFSEAAVPNARARERIKRIKTSNLCDLLPLYGPWPGHKEPKILLRSRLGSLVSFNPFSSELTNSNQIVSGGSGSGKSFLTNVLLMQMMKENPRVFIVDIGGSYKKICDNFEGQYIPLGVDTKFSINPFDLQFELVFHLESQVLGD